MADLKAAAKRLRESAVRNMAEVNRWPSSGRSAEGPVYKQATHQAADDQLLAAQALEAWAWQEKRGVSVEECSGKLDRPYGRYRVMGRNKDGQLKRYYADTPLGAVLAAMEAK